MGIEPYLQLAEKSGVKITHIIDTHIHADHLSGSRKLAEATGAPIYLHESAEAAYEFVPLAEGDEVAVGNVVMSPLHTPGHTPESMCLVVEDRSRGEGPWFVLTGDTLFVGDVGRPDLVLDTRKGAAQLYDSLFGKLLALDDALEIYPAHSAGSVCGRHMSGKPSSTIGFEKRFNIGLQARSKDAFIEALAQDIPPQPEDFANIRRSNMGLTT